MCSRSGDHMDSHVMRGVAISPVVQLSIFPSHTNHTLTPSVIVKVTGHYVKVTLRLPVDCVKIREAISPPNQKALATRSLTLSQSVLAATGLSSSDSTTRNAFSSRPTLSRIFLSMSFMGPVVFLCEDDECI